jgi:ATP-binding cassette subfamily F protein 3
VLNHYHTLRAKEQLLSQQQVQSLEEQIQQLDIENNPGDSEKLQLLCEKLSSLDEEWGEDDEGKALQEAKIEKAKEALLYLAVPEHLHNSSMENLSPGMVQKVLLACAYFYQPQLLLLDEPTKDMDVIGLVKLRRMIYEFTESGSPNPRRTTVVLVSHDMDLMNDVVTDIIYFHDLKLEYYPNCNYCGFLKLKFDRDIHSLRETHLLDVKRTKMIESIDKMKERTLSGDASSVGAKKLQKVIENKQKKLDKAGIERDAKGHRWQMQKMGTGMKIGSINSVDTSSRKKISYGQLVKMTGANVARLIDKAIQFKYVS